MPTFVPTTTGKDDGKKAPFDFGASKKAPAYKSIRGGNAIGLAGAVADALRRTGEPASAIAYLAQGKPKEAAGSIADIVRQKEKVRTIGLSDIPVIKRGTDKLPWYIRAPTNFGLDIAGDPLTYLTFGTAGVARGASGRIAAKVGGRETAALAGKRIATSRAARGTPEAMPLLQDAASAAALTALERKGLDPALQVGLRIPFSREKALNVAGLNLGRAKRALDSAGGKIPGGSTLNRSTRESFLPSRGAGKGMRYIHQTTRRAAEVEARAWQKEAQTLGKRIFERARKEGVKPADLNRLIARHIDNPTKYDAPTFAQDLVADTRAIFERISQRELADGVRRESRENYIPHLIIKDRDAKDLGAKYSDPLVTQENPFFTKERVAPNFDALDHQGVKYETNIERLIEARSAASTRARTKLAIDKATYERFGVGAPLADTTAARGKVEAAREKWVAATDRYRRLESMGADRTAIDAARQEILDAKAGVEAAKRVVPLAPVRDAEAGLDAAEAARSGVQPAVRPGQRAALPTAEELAAANYERGLLNRIRDEIDGQANEWRGTIADARRTVQTAAAAGRIDPRSFERIGRRIGALQARASSLRSSTGAMTRRQSDAYGRVIDRLATLHVMLRDAGNAPSPKQIAELGRELGRLERTAPQELQRLKNAFGKQAAKVRAAERAPKRRVAAEAEAEYAQEVRRYRADRAVAEAEVASATRALREARRGRDVGAIRDAETSLRGARTRLNLAYREAAYQAGRRPGDLAKAQQAQSRAEGALLRAQRPLDKLEAANRKLMDVPVSRFASSREWGELQQGWEQVATSPRFKDALLPPQAAKDLKAVHKAIADSMKDPVAPLKFLRATGGTWKRLALATPGFHVRNQFDDALRAWWAGARNPQSYVQSARVLRGGNLTVKTKSGTYNGDELFDLARTHGVVDVGFVAQEAASSESRHRIRVDAMRYGRGRYANVLKASEDVGAFREDWNRMGLFIERLKAGDNPVQAAEQVRKYMFDYGDVGAFVSTARRYWTPFITYASKSIPLVAGEFARRPGRLSHIYAAQRTAWEEAGQPDMSTLAPEDRLSLPLPPAVSELLLRATGAKTAKGENPTLLLNPKGVMGYSMLNDIASIRGFRGTEKFASSFLGPAPKFAMEFIPGRSMYFGRDFAKSGVKANAVEALLARATGGRGFNPDKEDAYTGEKVLGVNARLSYLMRLLPQVNQASAVATLIPGAQGTNTSARLPAFRTLGGLPITPLDRAKRQWEIEKFGGD